ncbi:MAG: membrane protein insertion efficiency factor YidD [Marinomonas sp.]|nr:MAG: membrane protein insertion efficiency factor YidD [Marinomonas sp.]
MLRFFLKHFVIRRIRHYRANGGGTEQFRVSCNFHPTCSEYAIQAIEKYGLWRGGWLTLKRLRRCNIRDQVGHIDDPLL